MKITLGSSGLSLWSANTTVAGGYLTATNQSHNGSVAVGATATPTGGQMSGTNVNVGTTLPCEVISS